MWEWWLLRIYMGDPALCTGGVALWWYGCLPSRKSNGCIYLLVWWFNFINRQTEKWWCCCVSFPGASVVKNYYAFSPSFFWWTKKSNFKSGVISNGLLACCEKGPFFSLYDLRVRSTFWRIWYKYNLILNQ